jgi:hypothetical protein
MKKPITKGDYKRKRREVKRTSQKLAYPNYKNKNKFRKDDIVKLDGGEDMGYVQYYVYDKVLVKWSDNSTDYYDESQLKKVI